MKLVRIRFRDCVLAFDDERMPVSHHFHNPAAGLTIEVRRVEEHQLFIYGWLERDGITTYAGQHNGIWIHGSPDEFAIQVSAEIFRLADELGLEAHHVWPFVDQLPVFTATGVSVATALSLSDPIKDLLARGAPVLEVMNTLGVDRATIEFALGVKLPSVREVFNLEEGVTPMASNPTNW